MDVCHSRSKEKVIKVGGKSYAKDEKQTRFNEAYQGYWHR